MEGESPQKPVPSLPESRFSLAPGTVLAERYRVLRLLGSGANGAVYAAEDLMLGGEVAVKVLNRSLLDLDQAIERFKREAILARRISHPNVCRLHDVGLHRQPGWEPILFLTMELLRGETLAHRIETQRRLREAEALEIAKQLAAGLGAAHRAGVIHRDFKSSNVVLVREGPSLRAVITDFGLATALRSSKDLVKTLTQQGSVVGTPAYMAPEQVEGKPVDGRADIYALGVVLYEMLTGELPFDGDSPISIALKRVEEPPRRIETLRGDLSLPTRTLVHRCLERDPELRFQTAEELLAGLEGTQPTPRRLRLLRRWAASVGVGILLAAGVSWMLLRSRLEMKRPLRLAVASPQVIAPERQDWLAEALVQLLASELSRPGELETVPAERVVAAERDLKLTPGGEASLEELEKLRRFLGADVVLGGSVIWTPVGEGARLRLYLRPLVATGTGFTPLVVEGSLDRLFELAAEAARKLQGSFGLAPSSGDLLGSQRVLAWAAQDLGALRAFAAGMNALERGELLKARGHFEEAIRREPEFALAWAGYSRSWHGLGYVRKSVELAETALQKGLSLPLRERLTIEGQLRRYRAQWKEALALYRKLLELEPGDIDWVLEVAQVELEAGLASEALKRIERFLHSRGADTYDLRFLLLKSQALGALTRFREQAEVSALAAQRAGELGARHFEAQALLERAQALRKLGEVEQCRKVLETVERLANELGEVYVQARVWLTRANLERSEGRLNEAREHLLLARKLFAELENIGYLAIVEYGLAVLEADAERPLEARQRYQEASRLLKDSGDQEFLPQVELNLGSLQAILGELQDAEIRLQEVKQRLTTQGKLSSVAFANQALGVIGFWRGELQRAERLAQQVVEAAKESGDRRLEGLAIALQAEVWLWRGEFEEAEKMAKAAHDILQASGNHSDAQEVRFLELRTRFERGERGALLDDLDRLAKEFEARPGGQMDAVLFELGRVLLRAGAQTAVLKRLSERARAALSHHGLFEAVSAHLFLGEAAFEEGNLPVARRYGQAALDRAKVSGARLFEVQAELLLARTKADRKELERVRQEAATLGLVLLERQLLAESGL
jgi:tetratricopeptide (TPR) repeat protein